MKIQSKTNIYQVPPEQIIPENMPNKDRNAVWDNDGAKIVNLTPLQLRQQCLLKTEFSDKKQIEKELKDVFLETKDTDNEIFLNKIYPVFLKFYGLEKIAPEKMEIIESESISGQAGSFLETTGQPGVYNNYLKNAPKKKIAATLAHELKHLKQFSLIYKYLGKDKFTEMACDDLSILKFYCKRDNLNAYVDADKIIEKIQEDIKNSKVYKKVEKLPGLTKEEQKLAIRYIEANSAYSTFDDDYEAYNDNLLEKEAFAEDRAMEDLYEKMVGN